MYAQTGSLIDGKFEVLGTLGSGGMGVVYETLQKGIDRKVALKLLTCISSSDAEELARFEREAFILSKLSHPNIVQFYSYGVWAGSPYIVMERLPGTGLQDQLRSNEPFDAEYAFKLTATLCGALQYAHSQNIFHRDVKPSNIMISIENDVSSLKVIDFGLAKILGSEAHQKLTQTGVTVGSVLYMSPEQCLGQASDGRSDVYSVGCLLHHLLTGFPPFQADVAPAVMFQHLNEKIENATKWSTLPPEAQRIISKCTAKKADERYPSAKALKDDLESALATGITDAMKYELLATSGQKKQVGISNPKQQQSKTSVTSFLKFNRLLAVLGITVLMATLCIAVDPGSLIPSDDVARNLGLTLGKLGLVDAEVNLYKRYADRKLAESGFKPGEISTFNPRHDKVASYSSFTIRAVKTGAQANVEDQREFAVRSFLDLRELLRGDRNGQIWLSPKTYGQVLRDNAVAMELIKGVDQKPIEVIGHEGIGLGQLLDQQSENDLAERVLLRSLRIIKSTSRENWSALNRATHWLADNYLHRGTRNGGSKSDLEKALLFYDECLKYRKIERLPESQATIHAHKAVALRLLKRKADADKEDREAFALLNQVKLRERPEAYEYFWNNVARVNEYEGNQQKQRLIDVNRKKLLNAIANHELTPEAEKRWLSNHPQVINRP